MRFVVQIYASQYPRKIKYGGMLSEGEGASLEEARERCIRGLLRWAELRVHVEVDEDVWIPLQAFELMPKTVPDNRVLVVIEMHDSKDPGAEDWLDWRFCAVPKNSVIEGRKIDGERIIVHERMTIVRVDISFPDPLQFSEGSLVYKYGRWCKMRENMMWL